MTHPIARSRDEAHLYLDLHPCRTCAGVDTTWEHAVVAVDGEPVARYSGVCSGCGAQRSHLFGLPEGEVVAERFPTFGGSEPSQLLDAGEWMWVADLTAGNVPADDPDAARQALAIAIASIDEVVKFIPPGEQDVPATAFWTERGKEMRDAEPGRFTAERLLVVRQTYQRIAERQ
ncbi:hypothetical protein GCM10022226_36080 [Sphaerisporangium flaviroseum]|uniref:Uncharacterized protein n=1 Tax=Sphaerisporangium flaviroseum TaxID=509199 RepID=A0ABP7I8I3_9ACTN